MAMLPARRRGQTLTLIDPTREFEDIYSRMGQLMNMAFGSALAPTAMTEAPWVPMADVSETDDAYQINVEVPGIPKDQIDVQFQDRELIISGQTPEQQQQEEGRRQHRNSRRMGRFEFRTYLPGDINPDAVRAELNNGVLTVTIPKSEAAKPRRVEISG